MRIFRFALLLLVPAAVSLAGGCMPLKLVANGYDSAGGAGGTANDGAGGNHDVGIANGTVPGATGSGGGLNGMTMPFSYAYLCGGSQPDCSPDPGSTDCAPGGSPNMSGTSSDAGSKLTCHLVADGNQAKAKCGFAGTAAEGDPCIQATDCQAGLGCSATPVTSTCRQYCCGDAELCPQDTYCTPTKMAESIAKVPLCMPVTPCELLNDAWCQNGQACAIVRDDGTTSCVDPGEGVEGKSCPCAAGYTCSTATGTCLKLCHINGDECGTGTCQGGTLPYPNGIGFCVPQSNK